MEGNKSASLQQAQANLEQARSALQPTSGGASIYAKGLETVTQAQDAISSAVEQGRRKLGEAEAALEFITKNVTKMSDIVGGYPQDEVGEIAGPLRTISALAENVQSENVAPALEILAQQAAAGAALDGVKSALQNAPNIAQGSAELIGRAATAIGQDIRE